MTSPDSRGVPLGTLALTLMVQSLVSLVVYAMGVLIPLAYQDAGVAATAIGVFTALTYGMSAFSAPIGGGFVARQGGLRVSQFCLLAAGIGGALCAVPYAWVGVFAALLIGVGYGPSTPSSAALLAERTPERIRNLIMSIRQTGVPIGGALAGAIVPTLALAVGWQAATVIIGVVCIVAAVAMQPLRAAYDAGARAAPAVQRPGLRDFLAVTFSHPRLAELALASFGYAGVQICLSMFMVAYLHEQIGYSVVAAGAVLATAMTVGIIGRVCWGAIADFTGNPRRMLGVLGTVMAVSTGLLGVVTDGWPFGFVLVLGAVFGASAIGWNGVFIAEISRHAPPGKVALATGASLMFTYTGVVVVPLAFSLLVATGGYRAAFGMLTVVTALAAGLFFRRAG